MRADTERQQRSGRASWVRVGLTLAALGLCACETEELRQLTRLKRAAQLERAELMERIARREEYARELQTVGHQLHTHCPPRDESGQARPRLQGAGTARDLVGVLEALGKGAPFLSLERLSLHHEKWSMEFSSGPACQTLEEAAAQVTRYPLPPRGLFWPGTSKALREDILAAERDIQQWESTVLAGVWRSATPGWPCWSASGINSWTGWDTSRVSGRCSKRSSESPSDPR
ncbi:hypothetical protein NVS55_00715 [Myxococcus stipitatus]|uniref:hypothetical protein n=1 Tax=Myxococcus stipitatus TaxID=83455 RepID=UPI0031454499